MDEMTQSPDTLEEFDQAPSENIAELLGYPHDDESVSLKQEQEAAPPQAPRAQPPEAGESTGDDKPEEASNIENRVRNEIEAKYTGHPAFNVGMRLLEAIAKKNNVGIEAAARIADDNYYSVIAAQEHVTPNVARAIFGKEQQQAPQPPADIANRIREDLASITLPEGFDFFDSAKDDAFVELLLQMPTEAAIRVYNAEKRYDAAKQDMAEKVRAQGRLPQPLKDQQAVIPKVDLFSMTDEEFFNYEERMRR